MRAWSTMQEHLTKYYWYPTFQGYPMLGTHCAFLYLSAHDQEAKVAARRLLPNKKHCYSYLIIYQTKFVESTVRTGPIIWIVRKINRLKEKRRRQNVFLAYALPKRLLFLPVYLFSSLMPLIPGSVRLQLRYS